MRESRRPGSVRGQGRSSSYRDRAFGLDLAKKVFQVHAVDAKGEVVVARKLTRGRLVAFFAELAPCVVAMEACGARTIGGGNRWRSGTR